MRGCLNNFPLSILSLKELIGDYMNNHARLDICPTEKSEWGMLNVKMLSRAWRLLRMNAKATIFRIIPTGDFSLLIDLEITPETSYWTRKRLLFRKSLRWFPFILKQHYFVIYLSICPCYGISCLINLHHPPPPVTSPIVSKTATFPHEIPSFSTIRCGE